MFYANPHGSSFKIIFTIVRFINFNGVVEIVKLLHKIMGTGTK